MTDLRIVTSDVEPEPDVEPDKMKLYTVHTTATYEQMTECGVLLTEKTKRMAVINEMPTGFVVVAPPRLVWTQGRWIAAIGVLAAAPFVFRFLQISGVDLSPLQGFGIGWITAGIVLLLGRAQLTRSE